MIYRTHRLAPLCIETAFAANRPSLLQAAISAYGWCESDCPDTEAQITLRLTQGHNPKASTKETIAVRGARLTLAGDGYAGWADAELRHADCMVSPAVADDPQRLAELVIEPLLLFLLTRTGRSPIHAAGLMLGEMCIILAGESGSGKSTLALTASRRGLEIVSDDTVYIETGEYPRLWGWPGPIHIAESEASPGDFPIRLRGQKRKAIIPHAATRAQATPGVFVVLERGSAVQLECIGPAKALQHAMQLEPGFDLLRAEIGSALESLLRTVPAYRLTLTGDPHAAIDCLESEFAVRP